MELNNIVKMMTLPDSQFSHQYTVSNEYRNTLNLKYDYKYCIHNLFENQNCKFLLKVLKKSYCFFCIVCSFGDIAYVKVFTLTLIYLVSFTCLYTCNYN